LPLLLREVEHIRVAHLVVFAQVQIVFALVQNAMKELRSFDSLAAMLATLRSGSPSKAARMLGRAPSSIYRAIDRLEEDVGAALFVRVSTGWKATDAGLKIARLGERMQIEIAEAELALLYRSCIAARDFRHLFASRPLTVSQAISGQSLHNLPMRARMSWSSLSSTTTWSTLGDARPTLPSGRTNGRATAWSGSGPANWRMGSTAPDGS